ncbi:hypothetical protein [Aliivibrio finisterrensis]|uniref:hypothetical protein n=1 Tax=Aliivibrio finisterrensis TaxID=511998 RepID=UPI001F5DFBD8|nr:hypothetical protein [Aliivibrio finisterrensis]
MITIRQRQAIAIAVKATEIVKDPENADKLDQPNFKPTIPVDNSGTVGEAIINNKLVVSKSVYDNLIKQVNKDKFTDVTEISLIDLPIAELFVDTDNKNDITPTVKITTKDSVDVTADFEITKTATELTISAKDSITTVRNIYIVTLSATDIAANNKNMGIVSTTFEIKVELENAAPTLNPQVRNTLQEWLGSLELQQNVAVFNEKMRISELFADDQDKLTYNAYSSVAGLEFSFPPFLDGGTELEIIGKPSHAYPAGETITISATDGTNTVYEAFTLSAIAKAGITVNEVKYAALQEKIADITLKQNTPVIEAQLNITELFNTESVNGLGAIEYYAGLEDKAPGPNGENLHEGFTTVDGVNVNVDTNGILTISGEPGKVIKGGYFYLMTGINDDAPDAIISEMVKITLPDVKPAEEVIPPTDTKLEDITWYVAEYGTVNGFDSNTGHDQIWCESIKFNNGKVFTNTRSATNLKSCSEANVEWDGATYIVSEDGKTVDASLPMEENNEIFTAKMRYALTQVEDEISKGSATVYMQELDDLKEIIHSQRYTFFSEKADLEARLNIQSNSGWEGRVFPMYLPSASGPKLGTVTLSLEENTNSNDDGSFDADVTFDLPGESITCEMVRGVFRSFTFSDGNDITSPSFECYNGQDDGSEIQHATVDFDLPNLTVNDVYSILGKTTESGRSQVELIKFNIEWTGVGNNE